MKYAIVILSGAADAPHADLDGATPLSAADAPNLEILAEMGRVGGVVTTPPAHNPSSEIGLFALLGYDPLALRVARGPVEAAGLGFDLGENDTALRASFVSVGSVEEEDDAAVLDHAVQGLTRAEARELLSTIELAWASEAPDLADGLRLIQGVAHRAVLIDSTGSSYNGVTTLSPPEIVGSPWRRNLPAGDRADAIRRLTEIAHEALSHHEINRVRAESGARPANMLWLWGAGGSISCEPLQERFGYRTAILATSTVASGVARLAGIDRIAAPGVTAEAEADLSTLGEYAAAALDRYDIVIAHVCGPDKAAHRRDVIGKTRALEEADAYVVGPLLRKLQSFGDAETTPKDDDDVGWRMLVAIDHATHSSDGAHSSGVSPFVLAGGWVRKVLSLPLTELGCLESDLHVDPGYELLEYALYNGLKVGRRVRRQRDRSVR